jgi:small subunit ribosomal protein S5
MNQGSGGRGGRRDGRPDRRRREREEPEFDERIVDIARTAKVLKGGRRFGFRVLVVVGDNRGRVGVAVGKAREVPEAISKGLERAKRGMIVVPMVGQTIPHEVGARQSASKMLLRPARPGTGVIAGRGARAVLEAAGIRDVLAKNHGSNNILNVTLGTFEALKHLKEPQAEAHRRGRPLVEIRPIWSRYDE